MLIADDDPALRRSLERVLRLGDYRVILADSGQVALAALASGEVALVVLDLEMPPPDGLSVLRRMRAAGDLTPVLILTARSAQLLLERDPGRVPEQLLRLQEMTGEALSQLRSLITQMRPQKN